MSKLAKDEGFAQQHGKDLRQQGKNNEGKHSGEHGSGCVQCVGNKAFKSQPPTEPTKQDCGRHFLQDYCDCVPTPDQTIACGWCPQMLMKNPEWRYCPWCGGSFVANGLSQPTSSQPGEES